MVLFQSRQGSERDHMQQVADTIEDSSSSSVEQLFEVIRYFISSYLSKHIKSRICSLYFLDRKQPFISHVLHQQVHA